jgi:LuxR family maltose regulon positive regulatory protein
MTVNSVIRTRLYPPVSRAPLIERARLLELLGEDCGRRLTVVAAPAGFGKTTILGQWFERLRGEGQRCCWCSLDREDNQPQRFLRHVVSALQTVSDIGADVIRQLDTTLIADIVDTLPALVDDLADCGHGTVLFLDDYHHVRSDEIHRYVERLVMLAPASLRIVIASRLRPQLALASLRMRGQLCEITANHLRFDLAEAKDFMRRTVRLDLSAPQLDRLYEHSEGWAAGLQLASLSLRDAARRDSFIASFSGSLREIADYLATDVLNQQDPTLRDFLLRTAILDRVSAAAAAAVTRNPEARSLLETAEASNLFLVPLDDNREWYRYHHLFQEFLLAELRRTYPDEFVSLYRRASDWFADAGYGNEAVNYALLSGDLSRVGRLVHAGTLEHLAMDGKMTALLSWVSGIPGNIKTAFPRLLVQECIALSHLCRSTAAADVAEQARTAIDRLPQATDYRYSAAEVQQLRQEASVLPCMVAFCKDDIDLVEAASLAEVDSRDDLVLAMANNFMGYAALLRLRLEQAEYYFGRGRFHHVSKGTYYGAVFSDCFYAMSRLLQFRIGDAYDHALSADRLVDDIDDGHVPGRAKARVMQAVALYEWNRLDEAEELLDAELHKIEAAGQVSIAQHGFIALARCRFAAGRHDQALNALDRCLQASQHTNREYINLAVEIERARMSGALGAGVGARSVDPSRLGALLERLRSDWNRVTFARPFLQLQNCVYGGRLEVLDGPMQEFRALCRGRGLMFADLQLQLLSALGHQQRGEHRLALELVRNAVTAACPENGLRRLLDAGHALQPLYAELQREESGRGDSIRRDFVARLLDASAARRAARPAEQGRAAAHAGRGPGALIEALSSRELQVLEWMARGDSNAVIGAHLLISENTVKWHVKNVFAKLGVNNRTAAVMAAQQHQLLV